MGKAATFRKPNLVSNGVLARARADNKWNKTTTARARTWYERFLEVCYNNRRGARIYLLTAEADKLWHTHITFTRSYRNYCESVLGSFLDHTPVIPRRAPTKAERARARVQYKKWLVAGKGPGAAGGAGGASAGILPDMIIQCHP
ncbi:MAG TPA: hypothetical protein VGT01_03730 [Candidatus Dormibacteraeota bacterium]|nr:hypothetical protein [Candidatus Dormibacteraeota bacterium]HEV2477902.1 hypothetical protein [Candidatus Dormibacteraeota bacterium]